MQKRIFFVILTNVTLQLSLILLPIVFWEAGLNAQTPIQVIKPSPEVASLFKYVEYPVDYLTGLPQTSIPLYEVKSGNLSLPITLNYHSSGRKTYDETGAVGLGWTLMAGGTISRTVYGFPDDDDVVAKFPVPWKSTSQIDQHTDADAWFLGGANNESYAYNRYDTQYDIFSYFVNGISGKFALRDNSNVKIPVFLPKKPYKVQPHKYLGGGHNYFDYIDLIDDKGVLYEFGATEISTTIMSNGSGPSYTPVTAWQLTKIVSADHSDSIVLKYTVFNKQRTRPVQQTTVIDQWQANPNSSQSFPSPNVTWEDLTALDQYSYQRLTEIDFVNGKAVFNLQSGSDIVQSMQVFDKNGNNVKTVNFSLSNLDVLGEVFVSRQNKKLDSISIQGVSSNDGSEKYKFDYFPTVYAAGTNALSGKFCDLWGYYNASGVYDMRPYVPNVVEFLPGGMSIISVGNSLANRSCNLSATESGVLKKITYPTGGSSEFTYELNQYQAGSINNSGGLRIAQIKTNDGNNNYLYKTYTYGLNESGYGWLPFIPNGANNLVDVQNVSFAQSGSTYVDVSYRQRIYSTEVNPVFSYIASKPVIYSQVTEYLGSGANTIGKTVYTYDNDDVIAPVSLISPYQYVEFNYCKSSSLVTKEEYKNTNPSGTPNYQLIRKLENSYYVTSYDAEKLIGLRVQKKVVTSPLSVTDNCGRGQIPSYLFADTWNQSCVGGSGLMTFNVFYYGDYGIVVGKKELTGSTVTEYTDARPITTTAGYTYNTNHLLNTKTTVTSKGENYSTTFMYPFDYSGNTTLSQMIGLNMLNYPVEQIETRNSLPVKSVRNNYYTWNNSPPKIYPKTIDVANGANAYETRLQLNQYDNSGNLLEQQKSNDAKEVYLWGYNSQYPVAKIVGSDYATVRGIISNQSLLDNPTDDNTLRNYLNNLRTSLPNALVSTYTYRPLLGMTSSTDANGRTTYYEYDGLNRLKLVKDQDGNIIKTFDYHYKQ